MAEQRRVVTATPENSETPLASVRSWVTPTPWFFVRNHFEVPPPIPPDWRVLVGRGPRRVAGGALGAQGARTAGALFLPPASSLHVPAFLQPLAPVSPG